MGSHLRLGKHSKHVGPNLGPSTISSVPRRMTPSPANIVTSIDLPGIFSFSHSAQEDRVISKRPRIGNREETSAKDKREWTVRIERT